MKYYNWLFDNRYLSLRRFVDLAMAKADSSLMPEYKSYFGTICCEFARNNSYPTLEEWVPFRMMPSGTKKQLETKILPDFYAHEIISSRVVEHLGDILQQYGVLYPFELINAPDEERTFYFYHCTNQIDCLNKQRSVFDVSPDGIVTSIDQCFLDHSMLTHKPEIFCLENNDVYVSETFKERVASIKPKLSGLELREEGIKMFDFDYKPWRSTATVVKKQPQKAAVQKLATAKSFQSNESNSEQLTDFLLEQIQIATETEQLDKLSKTVQSRLKQLADETAYQNILGCKRKLTRFDKDFIKALKEAIKRSAKDKTVKALYFEYHFDGGVNNTANFFLCQSYDQDYTEWASFFSEIIGDIPIYEYFNYDPDFLLSEVVNCYAEFLIVLKMLSIALKHYKKEQVKYPLSVASHDWCEAINLR